MNIGFVAHDAKKILMQNFCIAYRGIICKHNLYATASTGRLIEEATGLQMHKFLAGHLGGVQQMGALIEHNEMDMLIFLQDPENPNIPYATNVATAELLIKALDRGDLDWRELYRE